MENLKMKDIRLSFINVKKTRTNKEIKGVSSEIKDGWQP